MNGPFECQETIDARSYTGRCFCGEVEIVAKGAPLQMGYCHCGSCRTYSGAPLTAFILWQKADVRVTMGAEYIGRFNKTGTSERQFCTRCGGHLMTGHPSHDLTDVHAAVFPDMPFQPSVHLNYAETVLPFKDGLPKFRDFPAGFGSGETMPE